MRAGKSTVLTLEDRQPASRDLALREASPDRARVMRGTISAGHAHSREEGRNRTGPDAPGGNQKLIRALDVELERSRGDPSGSRPAGRQTDTGRAPADKESREIGLISGMRLRLIYSALVTWSEQTPLRAGSPRSYRSRRVLGHDGRSRERTGSRHSGSVGHPPPSREIIQFGGVYRIGSWLEDAAVSAPAFAMWP